MHQNKTCRAWLRSPRDTKDRLDSYRGTEPTFLLEETTTRNDGTTEYRVLEPTGVPIIERNLGPLKPDSIRYNLATGWIILESSQEVWAILGARADEESGGQLVIRLSLNRGLRSFDITPPGWTAGDQRATKLDDILNRILPSNIMRPLGGSSELSFTLMEGDPLSDEDAVALRQKIVDELGRL